MESEREGRESPVGGAAVARPACVSARGLCNRRFLPPSSHLWECCVAGAELAMAWRSDTDAGRPGLNKLSGNAVRDSDMDVLSRVLTRFVRKVPIPVDNFLFGASTHQTILLAG